MAFAFIEHRYRTGFRNFHSDASAPRVQRYLESSSSEMAREIRALSGQRAEGRDRIFPFYSGIGKGRK
ncbi:unnamed protein product, partial [Mesorhabditis belari]|uniref:Uncharacterized protein n=1 Tax=Mesorhabditis belari TaxID=2138241 RepID=A0AAF3EE40_9BILA